MVSKGNNASAAAGRFRAKIEHALYSGDKKHVLSGLAIISILFGIPWYFMNQGTNHQSHQDYLEKARTERLSSNPSAK
ncbi:hypothetical protein Ancab_029850 [Ancistrocladus abbreviatus]